MSDMTPEQHLCAFYKEMLAWIDAGKPTPDETHTAIKPTEGLCVNLVRHFRRVELIEDADFFAQYIKTKLLQERLFVRHYENLSFPFNDGNSTSYQSERNRYAKHKERVHWMRRYVEEYGA